MVMEMDKYAYIQIHNKAISRDTLLTHCNIGHNFACRPFNNVEMPGSWRVHGTSDCHRSTPHAIFGGIQRQLHALAPPCLIRVIQGLCDSQRACVWLLVVV